MTPAPGGGPARAPTNGSPQRPSTGPTCRPATPNTHHYIDAALAAGDIDRATHVLLTVLANAADPDGQVTMKADEMAQRTRYSTRTISRAVNAAIAADLIERTAWGAGNKHGSNGATYRFPAHATHGVGLKANIGSACTRPASPSTGTTSTEGQYQQALRPEDVEAVPRLSEVGCLARCHRPIQADTPLHLSPLLRRRWLRRRNPVAPPDLQASVQRRPGRPDGPVSLASSPTSPPLRQRTTPRPLRRLAGLLGSLGRCGVGRGSTPECGPTGECPACPPDHRDPFDTLMVTFGGLQPICPSSPS